MKVLNHPSDTQLLDALEKALAVKPENSITLGTWGKGGDIPLVMINRNTQEVGVRVALRQYLIKRKLLPQTEYSED